MLKALIFDCDGVIVDTERDGHRVAFNRAFEHLGIAAHWDVDAYGRLLTVAGGKERMRHYFDRAGWPATIDRDVLIKRLHEVKTRYFTQMIDNGELSLRPGVTRIMDEALSAGVHLTVCSTSHEQAVGRVLDLLGPTRRSGFSLILAGDVVRRKKPDPEIYLLALDRLGCGPRECVVIEDSRTGLLAATSAGLHCVITTNAYTSHEDFTGADLVVPELGDDRALITIDTLRDLCR